MNLDIHSPISLQNQLFDSQDLQRSVCSDDRRLLHSSKINDRSLAVGQFLKGKTLNASITSPMHPDCTRDTVVLSVDDMDSVACLYTMDPVFTKSYASQVNTMDLLPVWCTDFEKCKQRIGLNFGCIPLSPTITYSGPNIQ